MATYIDFENILSQNWDPNYHVTGKPVPQNAYIFGLTVLDWDGGFKRRLRSYGTADLKIPFQYLEQIPAWSKGNSYDEVGDIMGRFEPFSVYKNSTAQEFSLNLVYYAEARRSGVRVATPWTLTFQEQLIKKLQGSVFPNTAEKFSPPPKFLLNIGNLYKDVPIIIKNVSIENLEPFDTISGLPMHRKVTVECRVAYPAWQAIDGAAVWQAYEKGFGTNGNEIFAYEILDQKYMNKNGGGVVG